MNTDMMIEGSNRKVWNTPVLEGLQGVADVRATLLGSSGDVTNPQSS